MKNRLTKLHNYILLRRKHPYIWQVSPQSYKIFMRYLWDIYKKIFSILCNEKVTWHLICMQSNKNLLKLTIIMPYFPALLVHIIESRRNWVFEYTVITVYCTKMLLFMFTVRHVITMARPPLVPFYNAFEKKKRLTLPRPRILIYQIGLQSSTLTGMVNQHRGCLLPSM